MILVSPLLRTIYLSSEFFELKDSLRQALLTFRKSLSSAAAGGRKAEHIVQCLHS